MGYDTYIGGRARLCPVCRRNHPSAFKAASCWAAHDPSAFSKLSIEQLENILAINSELASRIWYAVVGTDAKHISKKQSDIYLAVVQYMRRTRLSKRPMRYGWKSRLSRSLGISPDRVRRLADKAVRQGDI